MRLAVIWEQTSAANYRAIYPMQAMVRRGHQVVWPEHPDGAQDLHRLAGCDLIHVYRRCDQETRRVLAELARGGKAVTYDNDDDYTAVPKGAPSYAGAGGLAGRRLFTQQMKVARLAHVVTTPTEVLAERYSTAGAKRVEVIGNYLAPGGVRPHRRHDGVVIGWVAGLEHSVDASQLQIADVLRRLMVVHEKVSVECIGVNLGLPERYTHDAHVHFGALPHRMGGFDIGIAPLVDIPFNRARSDIKLKEYAASGVPWLASPVGPYFGLGEDEGGRLVPDDGWLEALERLVGHRGDRRRLARAGREWAKQQTLDRAADSWEQLFTQAAGRAVSLAHA
jgi:hypothetical protein